MGRGCRCGVEKLITRGSSMFLNPSAKGGWEGGKQKYEGDSKKAPSAPRLCWKLSPWSRAKLLLDRLRGALSTTYESDLYFRLHPSLLFLFEIGSLAYGTISGSFLRHQTRPRQ